MLLQECGEGLFLFFNVDFTFDVISTGIKTAHGREEQREEVTLNNTSVTLQFADLTPDFNGDGRVNLSDFLLFASQFGLSRGDEQYDTKYDLDGDGTIEFGDFLIFGRSFGKGGS